jgi:hypothetical protein
MKHVLLGGLGASRLGLVPVGMSAFYTGEGLDDAESIRTIRRALDHPGLTGRSSHGGEGCWRTRLDGHAGLLGDPVHRAAGLAVRRKAASAALISRRVCPPRDPLSDRPRSRCACCLPHIDSTLTTHTTASTVTWERPER